MHVFIDESGTFSARETKNSVSAVGALVIPDQNIRGFHKLYRRVRRKLPTHNGEVKGRLLNEDDIYRVVDVLRKLGCLFEVVAVDSASHSENDARAHKLDQEEHITKHLTRAHHIDLVNEVWAIRRQLESTPLQLYVQSCALSELIYNTLNHANLFYSLRMPKELAEYHWVIDAKELSKITPWEEWWSKVILPMTESKSFLKPFIAIEGGDYRWHDQFKTDLPPYKKQFVNDPESGEWFDLKPVLQKDFRFSSSVEYGLEAVDVLVNAIRRSMAGNLARCGWFPIRKLMVHRQQHYIHLISLGPQGRTPESVPYAKVLSDFSTGGRQLLPKNLMKSQ